MEREPRQEGGAVALDPDRARLQKRGKLRRAQHHIVERPAVDSDRRGRRRVGPAGTRHFDAAADEHRDRLLAVGQHELETAVQRRALRGVEARRERVEEDGSRDRADEAAALAVGRRGGDLRPAQAGGGAQIIVAPRPRFGLIAELVIGGGQRGARVPIGGIGKDQLVQQFRPPRSPRAPPPAACPARLPARHIWARSVRAAAG